MPLVADDRDPDQIIRDLRDRIEELEPSLRDWKDMAMKYRSCLDDLRKASECVEGTSRTEDCACGHESCDITSGAWMGLDKAIKDARRILDLPIY